VKLPRATRQQCRIETEPRATGVPHKRKFEVSTETSAPGQGPVAGLVGIEGGVVSGVTNLESPGVEVPGRRPRHEERYQQA
jgi:hypothetical protein